MPFSTRTLGSLAVVLAFTTSGTLAQPATPESASSPNEFIAHQLMRRDPECQNAMTGNANATDAQACVDYLRSLGTQPCDVGPFQDGPTVMCMCGSAEITGRSGGDQGTSSFCADVATGAQAIVDSCNDNGLVSGTNTARGNGDFFVSIDGNAGVPT